MPVEANQLYRVGPDTLGGELFRRYWIPVEVSDNLTGRDIKEGLQLSNDHNPLKVKVLGEDLVLYRDGSGEPGLLTEHCSHRHASLLYGRVEEEGLRCIYHGWKYDREGNCLETPAEPPDSHLKDTIKHTAYPCREEAGLIFAYMGPPDKMPPFPRYPQIFREDGIRITGNGSRILKANFFTQLDNVMDVWHVEIAHGWFKPTSQVETTHHGKDGQPPTPIKYAETPWGVCYQALKNTEQPGIYEYHDTHFVFPNMRFSQPDNAAINWWVPIDDYTTRWFGIYRVPDAEAFKRRNAKIGHIPVDSGGNFYDGWFEDVGRWHHFGHQLRPGQVWEDEAAMSTQAPSRDRLPDFDHMRLTSADRGVQMARDLWRQQIERVQQGLDPIGINSQLTDGFIPVPAERRRVSCDEGMKLMDMSLAERWLNLIKGKP